MAPVRAVDEDVLAAADLRRPDVRERVVRAFGAGSGLLVGHVRRHRRDRGVLRDRQVFGMRAEPALDVSEHPVADLEGGDAAADRLDHSRELGPEDARASACRAR